MVQPRAGQGSVQIALRLPEELRDRLRLHADANSRSMNSEILSLIEVALWHADRARMDAGLEPFKAMDERDLEYFELVLEDIERRRAAKDKLLVPSDLQDIAERLERIEKLLSEKAARPQIPGDEADPRVSRKNKP